MHKRATRGHLAYHLVTPIESDDELEPSYRERASSGMFEAAYPSQHSVSDAYPVHPFYREGAHIEDIHPQPYPPSGSFGVVSNYAAEYTPEYPTEYAPEYTAEYAAYDPQSLAMVTAEYPAVSIQDLTLEELEEISGGRQAISTERSTYTWGPFGRQYEQTTTRYDDGSVEVNRPGSVWSDSTRTNSDGSSSSSYTAGGTVGTDQAGAGVSLGFTNHYGSDGSYTGSNATASANAQYHSDDFNFSASGTANGAVNVGPTGITASGDASGSIAADATNEFGDRFGLSAAGSVSGHAELGENGIGAGYKADFEVNGVADYTASGGEKHEGTLLKGGTSGEAYLNDDGLGGSVSAHGSFAGGRGQFDATVGGELNGDGLKVDGELNGSINTPFASANGSLGAGVNVTNEGDVSGSLTGRVHAEDKIGNELDASFSGEINGAGDYNVNGDAGYKSFTGETSRVEAAAQGNVVDGTYDYTASGSDSTAGDFQTSGSNLGTEVADSGGSYQEDASYTDAGSSYQDNTSYADAGASNQESSYADAGAGSDFA